MCLFVALEGVANRSELTLAFLLQLNIVICLLLYVSMEKTCSFHVQIVLVIIYILNS